MMKKLFILILLLSNMLLAIGLMPIIQTIDSKRNKNITFSVSNGTADPVAVRFSIEAVTMSKERKEIRSKTDKVSYYPSQFILNPKETKKVRVKYMSNSLPEIEEIYRVIVKELDIDVKDKPRATRNKVKAKINLRYSYEGLLFVHSAKSKANLSISSIAHKGKSLIVHIQNQGQISALPVIEYYHYIATLKNGKEHPLTKKDLLGTNAHRVLPGRTSTFKLSHIKSVPVKSIQNLRIEARSRTSN